MINVYSMANILVPYLSLIPILPGWSNDNVISWDPVHWLLQKNNTSSVKEEVLGEEKKR